MTKKLSVAFTDLQRLYNSKHLDPSVSPQTLQDKVQFDIRFYFIRRANENIDKFTKDTFTLCVDANTGRKYIKKQIDEQTKNHQDDTTFVSGIMPEADSELCPVKSFMKYLTKLHPRCDYLWQQVKDLDDFTDVDVWFKPLKIGENPLASFMSRISHSAELSKVYTNHSIRVTGTTLLGRANFSDKQIMAVTGHRSVNSLSIYKKVSDNEQISMGTAMTSFLQNQPPQRQAIKSGQQLAIAPKPNEQVDPKNKEIVQYEPEDPLLSEEFNQDIDFDVGSILQEIEQNNMSCTQRENTTSTSMTVQKQTIRKSPNIPIFQNCKIGSIGQIHFHIHKN